MSSPSTTAGGPDATPGTARDGEVAPGHPVAELSGTNEPAAELSMKRRPPRRRFLPPVAATAPPRELDPPDTPQIDEPPPQSPAPAQAARTSAGVGSRLPPRPANRRVRLAVSAAGGIVALGLLAAVAHLAGLGPFSRTRQYPVSAAPSDPVRRFAYFHEGAEAGDAGAQLELAILYAKGEGTPQDYPTAATWFRAAANQGVPRAQYDMGVLIARGRGVKVDLIEAAGWYRKAAQAGYPLAQYNLAVCYTTGQGVRQDFPEAALWYRRAAIQGVVSAMVNLATMYDKGEGVAGSPVDAYAWYRAAGHRDNEAAAKRAQDIFAALPQFDRTRAAVLANDVAASIHERDPGDKPAAPDAARH